MNGVTTKTFTYWRYYGIEDSANIGLSKSYEAIYRLAKDTVPNYMTLMKLNGRERNKAMSIIGNAIASASECGLARWVIDSINSRSFNLLKNVALYFYDKAACLKGSWCMSMEC